MSGAVFGRAVSRAGRWLLLISLLAIASTSGAHAQQRDQREVHAQELFALGRYPEALEIYGKLYAETSHPTYLRNIGRCYQNMGEPDKAIASFREYLRHAKRLAADQRALIDGYVREMQDLKAKRQADAQKEAEKEADPEPPPPVKPIPRAPAPPPPREAEAPIVRRVTARDEGAARAMAGAGGSRPMSSPARALFRWAPERSSASRRSATSATARSAARAMILAPAPGCRWITQRAPTRASPTSPSARGWLARA